MLNREIDFSQIPFFQFIFYYSLFIIGFIVIFFGLGKIFEFQKDLSYGVYSCLVIQVLATAFKIFFLNKDWKSPITIQYIIFGIAFILNLILLYFLTLLSHNVIAVLGFFATYFLHLKIIIFLGYKLTVSKK